eukprot:2602324-Amphidinium_carterae.3
MALQSYAQKNHVLANCFSTHSSVIQRWSDQTMVSGVHHFCYASPSSAISWTAWGDMPRGSPEP